MTAFFQKIAAFFASAKTFFQTHPFWFGLAVGVAATFFAGRLLGCSHTAKPSATVAHAEPLPAIISHGTAIRDDLANIRSAVAAADVKWGANGAANYSHSLTDAEKRAAEIK